MLGLPTALRVRNGHTVLFHEGGTSRFLDFDCGLPSAVELRLDDPSSRIWVLVDSNWFVFDPALIFERKSRLPDENENDQFVTGHYYRLPAANFHTIDSLFLIHPTGEPSSTLLMFQITRNIE